MATPEHRAFGFEAPMFSATDTAVVLERLRMVPEPELVRLGKEKSEELVKQLEAEKNISTNLLSSLCDANFWLASDADTVIRSEACFDAIMGHNMADERLSLFLSMEEQRRLAAILNNFQRDTLPVRSLPTTLNVSNGANIDVDLLIAQRPVHTESLHHQHYLVGVRVNNEIGTNHLITASESPLASPRDAITSSQPLNYQRRTITLQASFDRNLSATEDSDSSSSFGGVSQQFYRSRAKNMEAAGLDRISGPKLGPPFAVSGEYLRDHSKSLLQDLISSWNFHLQGCCTWHASFRYLENMLRELEGLHKCGQEWEPDILWQCQACTALHTANLSEEYCFICAESHDA